MKLTNLMMSEYRLKRRKRRKQDTDNDWIKNAGNQVFSYLMTFTLYMNSSSYTYQRGKKTDRRHNGDESQNAIQR
ncbi:hypothetical protein L365_01751 [Klebsiella pneumoniae MGH 19]|nr:hypothetical protein L365_01751 [Klebsiella pneumoniae MGH 19]